MSGWQTSVSGYPIDDSQQYDNYQRSGNNFYDNRTNYYSEDLSQSASHNPTPGAFPPPPKAARSDYEQASYGSMSTYAGSSGFSDPMGHRAPHHRPSAASNVGSRDPYSEGQLSHYSQSGLQSTGSSSYQQNQQKFYQHQEPPFHHEQDSSLSIREDWAQSQSHPNDNFMLHRSSQAQGYESTSYDTHQSQNDWSHAACDDVPGSATSSGRFMPRSNPRISGVPYGMYHGPEDSESPFYEVQDRHNTNVRESQEYGGWSHPLNDGLSGGDQSRKRMIGSSAPPYLSGRQQNQYEERQFPGPVPPPPSSQVPHTTSGFGPRSGQRYNAPILPGGPRALDGPRRVGGSNPMLRQPTFGGRDSGNSSSNSLMGQPPFSGGVTSLMSRPSMFDDGGYGGGSMMQPPFGGSDFNSRSLNRQNLVGGGPPMNRVMRSGGDQLGGRHSSVGTGDGPLNAIRGSPANFISGMRRGGRGDGCSSGPVSLMDATFAPPAGLPMQVKREKSIARWARAVRQEWPIHARNAQGATKESNGERQDFLQVTSFLSDILQKELRKNMTFLYGSLRDVAYGDRGTRGEFYPRDANEETVIVDLCYDDVFIAQGYGSQRFEAREAASQRALDMFLRDRVYVVGCYRLWEGEQIPGFCVSHSREVPGRLPPYPRNPKRERGITEKSDAKTLPWLQVNPSSKSKMDTSSRLKPKSMKDFFILINGRGDDYNESEEKMYSFSSGFPKSLNAVAVVNNSAQFNQMKVKYRMSTITESGQTKQHCVVLLDQTEVGEGVGIDAGQARRHACENVLERLSTTQPVVRMQLDRAVTVTRSELEGWSKKLADQSLDWVKEMDSKLEPPNPMKEPHLQRIMDDAEAYLKQYIHDDRQEPLKFGSEFTHDERMAIHKAARRLDLASKPYGPQWRLYQVVSLRFSLVELKRILLEKGVGGRYGLVERGSADMSHLWEEENETDEGNTKKEEKRESEQKSGSGEEA